MSKEKIYLAFFNTRKKKLYYNQLKEITNISYSSLQNSLKKMVENQEIIKEKTKSNVYYTLTKKKILEFSKISNDLILSLNRDVKIPLIEFINQVPSSIHSIVFFGSASQKKETEDSDLDLLIILENFKNKNLQKIYEKELKTFIKQISITTIYPISIVFTTKEKFKQQDDFLLKEAKNTGFAVKNQQKYYEDFS